MLQASIVAAVLLAGPADAAFAGGEVCRSAACPARDALLAHVIGPSSAGPFTSVSVVPGDAGRETNYAVGAVIRNDRAGGAGRTGNAVALFGAAVVNADRATAWGTNLILSDHPDNRAVQAGEGRALVGAEYDFSAYSPRTIVQGVSLLGSSAVQPASAVALTVGELSVQRPGAARWTAGLVVEDGVVGADRPAVLIGARERTGAGVGGQLLQFGWRDAAGAAQAVSLGPTGAGALRVAATSGPGRAGLDVDGAVIARGVLSAPSGAVLAKAVRVTDLVDAPDDRAARAAGVDKDEVYRHGSVLMVCATC